MPFKRYLLSSKNAGWFFGPNFFQGVNGFVLVTLALLLTGPKPVHARQTNSEKEIFMWVGAQKLQKERPATLENMLLFAKRFDVIPYSSGMLDPDNLEGFLSACKNLKIDKTWIEVGPGKEYTIEQFVTDEQARSKVLERFEAMARVYKSHYPEFARITLFDEAPLGAFKRASKNSEYTGLFEDFMRHGPEAFAYLYKAIKEVMPYAEVGIFMHHPHNASREMAGSWSSIRAFMKRCAGYEATPDFIFADVYRGYFARGYGMEATNAYVEDVARHTSEVAADYGIPAYQLGEMHTIKLGYTPGRLEIDQNIDAMIRGGVDGMGWYWPNYASTNYTKVSGDGIGEPLSYQISYDPFVPNAWGKTGPAGSVYATSKDRFVYSYLRMAEKDNRLHSTTHFDLWIDGYDFDHAEHRVFMKTNEENGGRWELIGHFNPQHDKEAYEEGAREKYIYSYDNKWHALAFHGLSRERYLTRDGQTREASVRIETSDESDSSKLSALYIMPYRATRHYITEDQITGYIQDQPRWVKINSLVSSVWPSPKDLKPGESVNLQMN